MRKNNRARWAIASLSFTTTTFVCWLGMAYAIDIGRGPTVGLGLMCAAAITFMLAVICICIATE